MSISIFRPALLAAVSSLFLLSACDDPAESGLSSLESVDGILRFVPADTPYVFAVTSSPPDSVIDKLNPQLDAALVAYHQIIRAVAENAFAQAREDGENIETFEKALPLIDELGKLMSVAGLGEAGIDRHSKFAMYGAGLLPVMRITLSDSALMEAAIVRLEEKAGQAMDVATIDGHSYRYAGNDEGRVILAILGNDLIIALVPAALGEDMLKQVLGLTLPVGNIADAGTLSRIADTYGFDTYMIGVLDFERIAATFLDQQPGINAEILTLMDYDGTELNDVCKSEIRSMAGVMPRMVMGYTELDIEHISSKFVVELRQDIAAAVSTLTGSVPGLGASHGGLYTFGMSVDLLAMRDFYSDRLDAMEAEPFECEHFADLQAGVETGREALNQPIPPIVYGFKGFLAVVDNIEGMDLANGQPPTSIDMRMLVATENAEGLLAMGAMFSPELAALNLEPDGVPVKFEMSQIEAMGQVVHVAMSETALGLSVGQGMEKDLGDLLTSKASDPSPFLSVDIDAGSYYGFMGDSMVRDIGDLGDVPEVKEAIKKMSMSAQEVMDRMRIDVHFTDRGIEVDSVVTLHE